MKQSTNYAVFWTLFHNLPYEGDKQELKEELVGRFTSGRTTSLRDTTRQEYKEMCDHLAKMLAEIPMKKHRMALSRKRSETLRLMTTYGVDTQDWAKINRFCEDVRIAGKPFAKLHFDDLATLSRKLRAMIGKKTTTKNTPLTTDKMKKKLYISAPISGGEPEERRKFFDGVARDAAERGWQPINPMDNGLEAEASWGQHMRKDILMMLECDAIILMSGWQFSRGCRLEEIVAREIGMEVIEHEKWGMPFADDSFKFNSTTF